MELPHGQCHLIKVFPLLQLCSQRPLQDQPRIFVPSRSNWVSSLGLGTRLVSSIFRLSNKDGKLLFITRALPQLQLSICVIPFSRLYFHAALLFFSSPSIKLVKVQEISECPSCTATWRCPLTRMRIYSR